MLMDGVACQDLFVGAGLDDLGGAPFVLESPHSHFHDLVHHVEGAVLFARKSK